jgi:hypothetical protein
MLTSRTTPTGPDERFRFFTQETVSRRISGAAWLDALAILAAILPLLVTAHLPLTDLPNHLARQYIIRDWASSPALQAFYYVRWALVPNLGLELFVLPLMRLVSPDMAMRLFCIATMLLLVCGTRLVNRTLSDGHSRLYRFAPLLCYGGPFQYGFLGYCFGVGLALVLFGVYLRIRTRPVPARIAVLLASSLLLLLCHLAAWGLLALAIGATELTFAFAAAGGLTRHLPLAVLRQELVPLCGLVPMVVVLTALSPPAEVVLDNALVYGTLHLRLRSLVSITLFTSPKLEVGLLALAAIVWLAALASGTIRWHRISLAVTLVMTVVWLLLPDIAAGTSFIAYRLPWAISFFLLAGQMPGPRYHLLARPFGAMFTALVTARIALIIGLWLAWEPVLQAIDTALQHLPVGARLMVIEGRLPGGVYFRQPELANVAAYAVARRQAFEPGMFAGLSGQILHFQPPYFVLWQRYGYGAEIPDVLDDLPSAYDHVLVLLPSLARIAPGLPLACHETGPYFALLKVMPGIQATSDAHRLDCLKTQGP